MISVDAVDEVVIFGDATKPLPNISDKLPGTPNTLSVSFLQDVRFVSLVIGDVTTVTFDYNISTKLITNLKSSNVDLTYTTGVFTNPEEVRVVWTVSDIDDNKEIILNLKQANINKYVASLYTPLVKCSQKIMFPTNISQILNSTLCDRSFQFEYKPITPCGNTFATTNTFNRIWRDTYFLFKAK